MSKKANYRKYNDRTRNSSTYHKKDCTNIRQKLKVEANKEIKEETIPEVPIEDEDKQSQTEET